jgi:hypothetical protein
MVQLSMINLTYNHRVLPVLVLAAVSATGLGWVTTAGFRSDLAMTVAAGDPTWSGLLASASGAAGQPRLNDNIAASNANSRAGQRTWFDRWWMAVQKSLKFAE